MDRLLFCFSAIFLSICVCAGDNASNVSTKSRAGRFGEYNNYYVYTRDNPREPARVYATTASANAIRILRTKTIIVVHDQGGSFGSSLNPVVKDALLTAEDVSVIVADWSIVANMPYEIAVSAVPEIGAGISELIRVLVNARKITLDHLHLVGFGLGAHVCGFAARGVTGTVARITALDPAGQLWTSSSERLRSSDAQYVEIIHTDSSGVGLADAIGHVDFFPNGGITQQGCSPNSECNHNRAWQLYAATLTHSGLTGFMCNEGSSPTDANCRGYTMAIGNNNLVKFGSGTFFIETSDKYPYDNKVNCFCLDA